MGDSTLGGTGQRGSSRPLAALAAVLVIGLIACGGDDDDTSTDDAASRLGEAVAEAQGGGVDEPSNRGDVDVITTTTDAETPEADRGDVPELPAPDIPADASPPTTIAGTEPRDYPVGLSGETIPMFGEIVVDLEPDGYVDVAVHLEEGQRVAVISAADDGVLTEIQIYLPDGTLHGSWEGGEEGVISGWEWLSDGDFIPSTGTYVFRVIHLGGSDEPFLLRFFGQT